MATFEYRNIQIRVNGIGTFVASHQGEEFEADSLGQMHALLARRLDARRK